MMILLTLMELYRSTADGNVFFVANIKVIKRRLASESFNDVCVCYVFSIEHFYKQETIPFLAVSHICNKQIEQVFQ